MRRIGLIWLLVSLSLASHAAQRYHLVRVVVTGSNHYSQDDLVRATGLRPNSEVTMEDLQQAANRMGNCGSFSSVQFQYKGVSGPRDSVEADFQVKDAEKFMPVVFENLVWYSDPELAQALHHDVPLFDGSLPLSGTLPDDVKAALSRLQTAKGLPAEVSYMLAGELGQPLSVYKFKVDNANLKIQDFRFAGVTHLPPEVPAQAVASARGADYLRSNAAKMLALSLLPLYRERGYLQASLGGIRPSLENGAVVLSVSVNEGVQYRLADFVWSGNTLIASGDLSKCITLKPGEPVNAAKLNHDLAVARKLFLKFGREAAVIMPVPTFTGETVTYVFNVKEGELYRMGELEIDGFDQETVRKLKENWKLAPGMPYDNTYLQQFLIRTVALGRGHQKDWLILEQTDDTQKVVNVRLQLKGE
jgi:outer membrane protein assembly factor BamA